MSRRLVERLVVCLSVFPALPVLPVLAQTDPRLVDVIRHAQEGRSDSARLQVQRLLATTSPTDTLYPQIVYTQAMVANDASDMRRQLQRVAVEYPSSSWADDALLRLVQLDYASANLDGAARNLERIRLDYPDSPLIPQTAYWAARTYFDQKKPETACRWVREGLSGSTGNIELQNQLRYLNQRCAQFAAAPDQQRGDTQTSSPPPADSQRSFRCFEPARPIGTSEGPSRVGDHSDATASRSALPNSDHGCAKRRHCAVPFQQAQVQRLQSGHRGGGWALQGPSRRLCNQGRGGFGRTRDQSEIGG
jgi:hypothetical protein